MPDVFLGRQPIVDRQGRVIAYELLFRASPGAEAAYITDHYRATTRVIERAFRQLGLPTVVGPSQAFVNVCAEWLMDRRIETLPADRVVLEILETVAVDDAIVRRCRELKRRGFRLALDDVYHAGEACMPLLDIVDIVKIDVLLVEPGGLAELVDRLKLRDARLLAEKVDTGERARECHALGFDLFQGFFFGRPVTVGG